jgi:uncharacterized protein
MSLASRIAADKISAMKSRDNLRLLTLRSMETAITNKQKENGNIPLKDDEIETVLNRLYKQRDEASEAYLKAGDQDRSHAEWAEGEVIKEYLPARMTEDEISAALDKIIEEKNLKIAGPAIGLFNKTYPNKADSKMVQAIANAKFK